MKDIEILLFCLIKYYLLGETLLSDKIPHTYLSILDDLLAM